MNEIVGSLTIGDKSRIFKVVKTPVPREKLPTEVQPLLGYEFYRIDPETGHAHELNEIFGEQAQVEFWMKLDDLAHGIVETLDLVSKPDAADLVQAPAENSALPVVYLAETTADMRDARDSLKRELQRADLAVVLQRLQSDRTDLDVKIRAVNYSIYRLEGVIRQVREENDSLRRILLTPKQP